MLWSIVSLASTTIEHTAPSGSAPIPRVAIEPRYGYMSGAKQSHGPSPSRARPVITRPSNDVRPTRPCARNTREEGPMQGQKKTQLWFVCVLCI